MIVEKHILIIWNMSEKSSSHSTSAHILHHHFREGGGSRAMMMLMTQGEVGGPKLAQSWWCNMCTLPNVSLILDIQYIDILTYNILTLDSGFRRSFLYICVWFSQECRACTPPHVSEIRIVSLYSSNSFSSFLFSLSSVTTVLWTI